MLKHSWKLLTFALILTISTVIVSAGPASSNSSVTFEVPFDFQIGGEKYEKGTYRVKRDNQNAIRIESLEGGDSAFVLGGPNNDRRSAFDQSTLTFHKYGERYFLRKVTSPTVSAYISKSKAEKSLEKEGYKQLAKVMIKPAK